MAAHKDLDLSRTYSEDVKRDYVSLLKKFPYRPTLFLGLGGTGAQAVSKIKDLFLDLVTPQARTGRDADVRDIDPMYAFRALDTNSGEKPGNLAKGREWLHLGVDNLERFYANQAKNRFFKDWVVQGYPAGSITAGCSGYRNLGRLALISNVDKVAQTIDEARAQISIQSPNIVNPRPVVFLFCSLSGGTGSGMVLDTCFLIREIFGAGTDLIGLICVFDGLPTMADYKKQDLLVNTFCGLKGLHAFMSRAPVGMQWGERIEYPFNRAGRLTEPFDECYLASSKRSDGQVSLPLQDHATSFLARIAFMMSAFSFRTDKTPDYAGIMNNHRDALAKSASGSRLGYLIPGLAQVHFPVEDTANLLALDAASRLLKLLSSGITTQGDEQARDFITSHKLDHRSLGEEIGRDPRTERGLALRPSTYDDAVEALFKSGSRYKNRDRILEYGQKIPSGRLQELQKILSPNVERLFQRIWPAVEERMAHYMVRPDLYGTGALDFAEDLCKALTLERNYLDADARKTVNARFALLPSQWAQIKETVTDVVTADGAADRVADAFNVGRAKALYITFLNGAEVVILGRAQSDLTGLLLNRLIDALTDLASRFGQILRQSIPAAIRTLDGRFRELATVLETETEGRDPSVHAVCSFNVMTEEWRRAYAKTAPHLEPASVLTTLMNKGWHPRQLLTTEVPKGADVATHIAQIVVDQVEPLTAKERNWGPLDVLAMSAEYEGQSPEERIARLYFGHLQPQMQLAAMKDTLGFAPQTLLFCGGITEESGRNWIKATRSRVRSSACRTTWRRTG